MGKKILIIDDDRAVAKEVQYLLARLGYTVYTTYDAEEGLQRLAEVQPDLILLDLVLPGHSGFQVAQKIKSQIEFKDIPIIAISLKKEDVDKHIAAKSGFVAYLEKPINSEALLFQVKDILGP